MSDKNNLILNDVPLPYFLQRKDTINYYEIIIKTLKNCTSTFTLDDTDFNVIIKNVIHSKLRLSYLHKKISNY